MAEAEDALEAARQEAGRLRGRLSTAEQSLKVRTLFTETDAEQCMRARSPAEAARPHAMCCAAAGAAAAVAVTIPQALKAFHGAS